MQRAQALVFALALGPASALAGDTVCIGFDRTSFASVNERATSAGHLDARQCFAALERSDSWTRIFVKADGAFQGEAIVPNDKLAYVLIDDLDLRLQPGETPFGRIVGGTIVVQEGSRGDALLVHNADGRVQARFLVAPTDLYPAELWPLPDPDEGPPSRGWPTGDLVPPPVPGTLQSTAAGGELRVRVASPSADIDSLRRDPGRATLRYAVVTEAETDLEIRLFTDHLWARGFVPELDWRTDPPATGWDPTLVAPPRAPFAAPARAIGATGAPISRAAKGEAFGTLLPGARVEVGDEDGSWVGVTAKWQGGSVSGWILKKHLVKEGKESPPPAQVASRVQIEVTDPTLEWEAPDGHEKPPELDVTAMRVRLGERIAGLRWAYAQALSTAPTTAGLLTVRMVVDPAGVVTEVTAPAGTLPEGPLREQVLAALHGLAFAKRKIVKKKGGPTDHDIVIWQAITFSTR